MRLDKFLSQQLAISRNDVNKLLRHQTVTLNGQVVTRGALHIDADDHIQYQGQRLTFANQCRYYMLHKPAGYICSTVDENYPSVLQLIDEFAASSLHIAGRLDVDTTGLVLLTDDGQWSHRITSPKYQCNKCYWIQLAEPLHADQQQQISQGLLLKGENKVTAPATFLKISGNDCQLLISEGRYHQIKRMFAAVGNHVCTLHRQAIGAIQLDAGLASGEYRLLTAEEIASV